MQGAPRGLQPKRSRGARRGSEGWGDRRGDRGARRRRSDPRPDRVQAPQRAAQACMSNGRADGQAAELDLSVGALVVYGCHGIGRVSSRNAEGQSNPRSSLTVVVEFPSGLSVILPFERATTCLRPLAGAIELDHVRAALRAQDVPIEKSWRARSQSTRSKILAGETIGLAEVVRDSVHRKRHLTPGSTLSPAEQDLYKKARHLLAAELGAVTHRRIDVEVGTSVSRDRPTSRSATRNPHAWGRRRGRVPRPRQPSRAHRRVDRGIEPHYPPPSSGT